MKFTVDYREMDPDDAYIKALDDVKKYIGLKAWKKFLETYLLRPEDEGYYDVAKMEVRRDLRNGIRMVCGFYWGISGYPVRALERFILRTHLNRQRAK